MIKGKVSSLTFEDFTTEYELEIRSAVINYRAKYSIMMILISEGT